MGFFLPTPKVMKSYVPVLGASADLGNKCQLPSFFPKPIVGFTVWGFSSREVVKLCRLLVGNSKAEILECYFALCTSVFSNFKFLTPSSSFVPAWRPLRLHKTEHTKKPSILCFGNVVFAFWCCTNLFLPLYSLIYCEQLQYLLQRGW